MILTKQNILLQIKRTIDFEMVLHQNERAYTLFAGYLKPTCNNVSIRLVHQELVILDLRLGAQIQSFHAASARIRCRDASKPRRARTIVQRVYDVKPA